MIQYAKKTDTQVEGKPYLEYGESPLEQGTNQHIKKDQINHLLNQAIEKAEQGDTEGALADIKIIAPMDYLKFKQQINNTLTSENKTVLKYEAPSFSPADVKLNSKQQEVWDLLQCTPKTRRIIWVTGEYGSGKSFLYNYIKANHPYRMYDAGQSASLDNVVYGYDEEGVIAWDLPRTFNFEELGNCISSVIEKFSDFGQSITSKKYSGKTQKVLGHAVVFSNHPPLDQLSHRDVIHIDLTNEIQPNNVTEKYNLKQSKQATPRVDCARQSSLTENTTSTSTLKNTLKINTLLNPSKKHTEVEDEYDPDYEYWSHDKQLKYLGDRKLRALRQKENQH